MGEQIQIRVGDREETASRAAPSDGGPGVLALHAWCSIAAILGRVAETDEWEPPVEETMRFGEALRRAGMDATFHVYPGTGHCFEEDRPDAYDPDAAALAWERTVEFLRRHRSTASR